MQYKKIDIYGYIYINHIYQLLITEILHHVLQRIS